MYTQLASRLSATTSEGAEYSQAVSMDNSNAAKVEITIFNLATGASSVTLDIEGSNDMQNWSQIVQYTGIGVGYSAQSNATAIAYQFLRLKYLCVGGGGVAVIGAGVNLAKL
ncbi:MAG: hypothetical protein K8T20_04450 [Planctomycetes bacterium]|nr:hypothetical protein [Planctomycetota bacterium]